MKKYLIPFLALLIISCETEQKESVTAKPQQVAIQTEFGEIIIELSDKTPQHRDNFLKMVEAGAYDSILFHRVLSNFVVQAGERDSTVLSYPESINLDNLIPAEFDSSLFHKRGALGAARTGNPDRASSPIQFYIVQRGPRADSLIDKDEERINKWLLENQTINLPENSSLKNALTDAIAKSDWETYEALNDSSKKLSPSSEFQGYQIPKAHREVYNTLGGTPHLDQNYTVFGEVIKGMSVVDSIAIRTVNEQGRPLEKTYIISAKVVKAEN